MAAWPLRSASAPSFCLSARRGYPSCVATRAGGWQIATESVRRLNPVFLGCLKQPPTKIQLGSFLRGSNRRPSKGLYFPAFHNGSFYRELPGVVDLHTLVRPSAKLPLDLKNFFKQVILFLPNTGDYSVIADPLNRGYGGTEQMLGIEIMI